MSWGRAPWTSRHVDHHQRCVSKGLSAQRALRANAPPSRQRRRPLVSVLVSLVHPRPGPFTGGPPRPCSGRSRTVADAGERGPTLLESVLGATPQEFESPILRHADLQEHPMLPAGMRASRVEWSHLSVSILSVERRLHRNRRRLSCQVTGIAHGPEQRATRGRSVRPTVQGRPGPSATGRIPPADRMHHAQ